MTQRTLPPGRPRQKAKQAEKAIRIYLLSQEYEQIKQAAARSHLPMSAWLRVVALREAGKE